MNPQKTILPKTSSFTRLFPLIFTCCLIACQSGDKTNQAAVEKARVDTTKKEVVGFSPGTFSYLMLPKAKVVELFAATNGSPNGETKKILLQFVDDNIASNENPIGAIAYGAKTNNVKTTNAIALEPITEQTPVNLGGLKYLGNLEITRKQLNVIFGNDGNPPLGPINTDTLYFVPVISSTYPNYVIYSFNKGTAKRTVTDGLSNPSPPAIPCPPPCDQ